jgi:hypothetical protein
VIQKGLRTELWVAVTFKEKILRIFAYRSVSRIFWQTAERFSHPYKASLDIYYEAFKAI